MGVVMVMRGGACRMERRQSIQPAWILLFIGLFTALHAAAPGQARRENQAASANPRDTSYLKLVSGLVNGQSISPLSRTVSVEAGGSIFGQFSVLINSTFSSGSAIAMGMTPSWGSHATSFVALPGFVSPVTDQVRNISLSLTAPATPGTYYLIVAFNTENTAAQVMSCSNWTLGNPVWDNGDDVADWTPDIIQEANSSGRVLVNYLYPSPVGNQPIKIPATAIILQVLTPATTTTTGGSSSTTTSIGGSTTTTGSGSTTTTQPFSGQARGALDYPIKGLILSGNVNFVGWAAVVTGSQALAAGRVELWVDGVIGMPLSLGASRADVQQSFASQGISAPGNLGFSGIWDSRTVLDGNHSLGIWVADSAGMNREAIREIANITVFTNNNLFPTSSTSTLVTSTTGSSTSTTILLQGTVRGNLEGPPDLAVVSGDVLFSGWAAVVSGSVAGPPGRVELLVDDRLIGQLDRGFFRPDVQKFFADQKIAAPDSLGFSGLWDSRSVLDGSHSVRVRAADAGGMGRESVVDIAAIGIVTANNVTTTTTTTVYVSTTTTVPNADRVLRLGCGLTSPGSALAVPVELVSQGDENAVGFSLTFDPTVLSNPQATWGSDASSALFSTNANQAAQGRFGVALSLPGNAVFEAGIRQVAVVTFTVASGTSASSTFLNFGNTPVVRQISSMDAQSLSAVYQGCSAITITHGFEADVTPRPGGKNNGTIDVNDWVQVCRFASTLDIPVSGSEFQRADCAPRQTLGDGIITITDCVQAGRYASGLDPATQAGGPASPAAGTSMRLNPAAGGKPESAAARALQLTGAGFFRGQKGYLSLELNSKGDEAALSFSLGFDPALLRFVSAVPGAGAEEAMLLLNRSLLGEGQLGVSVVFPPGQHFAPGTREAVRISFQSEDDPTASLTALRLLSEPVPIRIADQRAGSLPASFPESTPVRIGSRPTALSFPHVMDGGGYSTEIILENLTGQDASVQLDFYSDDGRPLAFPMGGAEASAQSVQVGARSRIRMHSGGLSAGRKTGWLRASSPPSVTLEVMLRAMRKEKIASQAGLAPSLAASQWSLDFPNAGGEGIGLAVSNPGPAETVLVLNLRTPQGTVVSTASLRLAAMGHVSGTLSRWFGRWREDFQGSLEILASGPVCATAISHNSTARDGLRIRALRIEEP